MTITVGDKVPAGVLMVAGGDGISDISMAERLAGKSVVIFGLPGAYTSTCSTAHVPSFIRTMDKFKAKGVAEIICVSVNDAFVMKAWGENQGVLDTITMIADPAGDFTKAVGLDMDGSKFGLGLRSQRYSMVVEDGVVKSLNVEEAGEFKVSSADYMLPQL